MIQKMLPTKLRILKISKRRKITSDKWIISTVTETTIELEHIANLTLNNSNKVSDNDRERFFRKIARLQNMGVIPEFKLETTALT